MVRAERWPANLRNTLYLVVQKRLLAATSLGRLGGFWKPPAIAPQNRQQVAGAYVRKCPKLKRSDHLECFSYATIVNVLKRCRISGP